MLTRRGLAAVAIAMAVPCLAGVRAAILASGGSDTPRAADREAPGEQTPAGAGEEKPRDEGKAGEEAREEAERRAAIEERRAAFRAKALELISDRNYDSKSSAHYIVRTDDPRIDVVKVNAFLESFRKQFEAVLLPLGPLRDDSTPAEILLFYSRYKYDILHGFKTEEGEPGATGHYQAGQDVLVVHTDGTPPGELPGLLTHEAAHRLIMQRLYDLHVALPSQWVNEGLASYFGFTRMDRKGVFHDGEIGGQEISLLRDTPISSAPYARNRLKTFQKLAKEAEPGFVDDLVREEMQSVFYTEESHERYSAAWLLVHYLLHGEGGTMARAFTEYIAREARGEGGADALYETIGKGREELEKGLVDYVMKLKARS